jgi:hypothetical protein
MNLRAALFLTFCCASLESFAEPVVPNLFVAGEPALAEEVNQNFEALSQAIESISSIPVFVNSSGNIIGSYSNIDSNAVAVRLVGSDFVYLRHKSDLLLSGKGFVYFKTADCTGQAFLGSNNGNAFGYPLVIYRLPDGYYVTSIYPHLIPNELVETVAAQNLNYWNGSTCSTLGSGNFEVYSVEPSSAAELGLTELAGPVTVRWR